MDNKTNTLSDIHKLLTETTVESLPVLEKVIEIDSATPIFEAFTVLVNNKIVSAPVYNKEKKEYVGFLDLRFLIDYVTYLYSDPTVRHHGHLKDLLPTSVDEWAKKGLVIESGKATAIDLAKRMPFFFMEKTNTLLEVSRKLAHGGYRRVPILDNGKVVNIISQSTLIAVVASNLKVTLTSDSDLSESGLGSEPVVHVSKSATVIETFKTLIHRNISGIAILDGTRVVGATTAKDIGLFMNSPSFELLDMNIFEYLKHIRAQLIDIKAPVVTVFLRDSISRVIALLHATKVHRLFVVNNEQEFAPVKVISITDVLRAVLALK